MNGNDTAVAFTDDKNRIHFREGRRISITAMYGDCPTRRLNESHLCQEVGQAIEAIGRGKPVILERESRSIHISPAYLQYVDGVLEEVTKS